MDHVADYIIAIATVLSVFGMVWKMTSDMRRFCEEGHKAMTLKYDSKISGVYKRFDQYKEHLELTHVSKEVFNIIHKQLVEDLIEIKSDVKKILTRTPKTNGSN